MNTPDIEVCIPVTEEYGLRLRNTLRFIPDDVGVIVTTRKGDWLPEMSRDYTVVKTTTRYSSGRFMNLAVKQATAEVIVLLDADFILPPGYFPMLRAWLAENDIRKHYLNSYIYKLDRNEQLDYEHGDLTKIHPYQLGKGCFLPGQMPCVLARRTFLDVVGGYDPRFSGWGGNDDDFQQRLERGGLVHTRLPLITFHQWHGDDSRYPGYYDDESHAKNVEIIRDNRRRGVVKVDIDD